MKIMTIMLWMEKRVNIHLLLLILQFLQFAVHLDIQVTIDSHLFFVHTLKYLIHLVTVWNEYTYYTPQ